MESEVGGEKMNRKVHYAWMIVIIIFLTFLAVQGLRLSFGAFVEPWEKDFALDRGTTSLISTLSFVVYGVSQPLIGKLVDKWGARLVLSFSTLIVGISICLTAFVHQPWQLFVLYCLFVSLGVGGASNVAATVVITNWFNEKRGLAFGIMETGFGAGQMVLVPVSLSLIHWSDWRMTVVILGLFLIVVVFPIIMLFLRNHPREKGLAPVGGERQEEAEISQEGKRADISFKQVIVKREFWLVLLPFFICGFTTTGLMDTHLIPFSHDHGFSTEVTSAAVSLLAGFNIIGILISGVVADRWSSRKFLLLLYLTRAVALFILLNSHNPALLFLFAMIYGLVSFATVAPTQMLITQYFKRYSVGFILGWLFLSHQIGSALGAYLPGWLYSEYGHYQYAIYISIALLVAATICKFLLPEPEK